MNKQAPFIIWLRLGIRMTLFAIALLWPAGTWFWPEAWVVIGLWSSFEVAMSHYLLRHDPTLLAERLNLVPLAKEQKAWDKVVMLLFFYSRNRALYCPGF